MEYQEQVVLHSPDLNKKVIQIEGDGGTTQKYAGIWHCSC